MLTQTAPTIITRTRIIDALAKLRQEWQQAVEGQSLVCVNASVGLMLADFVMAIGLTKDEQVQALGEDLVNELQGILVFEPGNNGFH